MLISFLNRFFLLFENSFLLTFISDRLTDRDVGSLELVSSPPGFIPGVDVLQISKLLKSY
jgi:hypothetical protein